MNLKALYEHPEQVQILRSRYFVEGAITGACACPEIPLPDSWLPWVIAPHAKSHGPNAEKSSELSEMIFEQLFMFFKNKLASMRDNTLELPDYAVYQGLKECTELTDYCSGLMHAHQSNDALWASAWKHMQSAKPQQAPIFAKDLKHCLLVFSTFAAPQAAVQQADARGERGLEKKLPLIAQSLNATLAQYVSISGRLAAFLPNQFETFKP